MPYEVFACPECGAEVDHLGKTFCEKCGVNFTRFGRLEKKTFYYSHERCYRCGKPTYKVEYNDKSFDQLGGVTKITTVAIKTCSSCGLNETISPYTRFVIQRSSYAPGVLPEPARRFFGRCPHCGSSKELYYSGRTIYQQKGVCFSCRKSFEYAK